MKESILTLYEELKALLASVEEEEVVEMMKKMYDTYHANGKVLYDKMVSMSSIVNEVEYESMDDLLVCPWMPHFTYLLGMMYLYAASVFSYNARYTGYTTYYVPPWIVRVALHGDGTFHGIKTILSQYHRTVEIKMSNVEATVHQARDKVKKTIYKPSVSLSVVRQHPQALLPKRATAGSAGLDLHCVLEEQVVVPPRSVQVFPTKLSVAIPSGYYGQIASRSGMAFKHQVYAFPGVIDADYRGEMAVQLINQSEKDYVVNPGDRIAQLLLLPCVTPLIVETTTLDATERANQGFGSSGQ